jgi:transcriptional regulator with XRE-family HTH domain
MPQNTTTPHKEIAIRLRGLRDAMDWSEETLAAKVGVTADHIRNYELGHVEIPASFLTDVAHATGVSLTELITGTDAHLNNYAITLKDQGLSVRRRKDYDYWNLAARMDNRVMEPFLVRVPPKEQKDLTFNSHNGQEFIYMLEGRLELWMGDKAHILSPGDSIIFDSHIPHALRGLDGKDALFLDVLGDKVLPGSISQGAAKD